MVAYDAQSAKYQPLPPYSALRIVAAYGDLRNIVALITVIMATCNACGATLDSFEYQTRAADEAYTSVTTCPNCPVSAEKISTSQKPRPSPKGMIRRIHRSMPVNQISSTSYKCGYILRVDIPKGDQLNGVNLELHHIVQRVSLCRQSTPSNRAPDVIGAFVSMNCMLRSIRPSFCSVSW